MHAMMMQTQSVLVLIPSVSTHNDSTNHDPWMQAITKPAGKRINGFIMRPDRW